MPITWNPADKNAGMALSGSNMIATSSAGSGTVNQAVRATQAIAPTTKQYFEVTITGTVGQYLSIGIMDSSTITGNVGIGTPGQGVCYSNKFTTSTQSCIYMNGTNQSVGKVYPQLASGQVMRVAVDRAANKVWWAINTIIWISGTEWMGSGTPGDNPATGTGGFGISAVTGTIYPAFSSAWTGDVATVNFGATTFAYAVPAGFVGADAVTVSGTQARAIVLA